jgi:hypothetical protein
MAGCPRESSHALAVAFSNGLQQAALQAVSSLRPAGRGYAPTIRRDHGSSSNAATPELRVRLFDLN